MRECFVRLKAIGWCTSQCKTLLFCAKKVVKESCNFWTSLSKKEKHMNIFLCEGLEFREEWRAIVALENFWYLMSGKNSMKFVDCSSSICGVYYFNFRKLWVLSHWEWPTEIKIHCMALYRWQRSHLEWRGWSRGAVSLTCDAVIDALTISSIPGNETFSCNSCFVFAIPWWPSCALLITLCWSEMGIMMILVLRGIRFDSTFTVNSSFFTLCYSSTSDWMSFIRVGSALVASCCSSVNVIALGTTCSEGKLA